MNRIRRSLGLLMTGKLPDEAPRDIPQISKEEVAEAREFFPMPKFFVFGYARSGTTLLARLLRLHPDVHCNWQAHFFTRPPLLSGMLQQQRFGDWLGRPSNRWNRGRDLSPVALRAMSDYILERDALKEGKRVVGDKSPNVLMAGKAVDELHRVYPDAVLVYIVRDGRDALLSHRFQNFIDGEQFLTRKDLSIRNRFARDPEAFIAQKRSIFSAKSMQRMAADWARNVTETHQRGRQLYSERYFSLRFEDLLVRPYEMLARIWTLLGVESLGMEERVAKEMEKNPDADWQQEKAPELAQALEKGRKGSWRDFYTQDDVAHFKSLAGEALVSWGYEEGPDWQ